MIKLKYAIFCKNDKLSDEIQHRIMELLSEFVLDYSNPDYVIVIGGDGTFLKAVQTFHRHLDKAVFISINTGKLGFYANYLIEDIDKLPLMLKNEYGYINSHSLLEIEYNGNKAIALNEVTVSAPPRLQNYLIKVDDFLFEDYYGNGILVCSPTGSTAYNKSLGGAIVDPMIKGLELTEIASINSRYYHTLGSSIVFDKTRVLTICPKKKEEVLLTYDAESINITLESLKVKISDRMVRFLTNEKNDFFRRVQKSFNMEEK